MSTKTKADTAKVENAEAVEAKADEAKATKPEAKTSNGKAQKHYVQWTLYHEGKRYKAGDELDLDADTAKPLVAAGVLVAAK